MNRLLLHTGCFSPSISYNCPHLTKPSQITLMCSYLNSWHTACVYESLTATHQFGLGLIVLSLFHSSYILLLLDYCRAYIYSLFHCRVGGYNLLCISSQICLSIHPSTHSEIFIEYLGRLRGCKNECNNITVLVIMERRV